MWFNGDSGCFTLQIFYASAGVIMQLEFQKPTNRKLIKAHVYDRADNDWYVDPDWCAKRLLDVEGFCGGVIDPSCGAGSVLRACDAIHVPCFGYDVVQRCERARIKDFMSEDWKALWLKFDIVSNPPFDLCNGANDFEYIRLCLSRAVNKVALILPHTFDCPDRNVSFLAETPFYRKYVLTPRPSMQSGEALLNGEKAGGGTKDFAFYVWLKGFKGSPTLHALHRDKGLLW